MSKKSSLKSKPVPVLDVTRFNFSAISTWLRCGKQYEFRYEKGIKSPPGIALIEGSAHHAALEMNNLHKRDRGFDLKPDTVTEKFMEELRTRTGETDNLDWEGESEDGLYERGQVWHKDYMRNLAPKINPDMIEEKFERPVKINGKEVLLTGVVDLGYKSGGIGKVSDYKTSSSFGFQSRKKAIESDLQLSFYAWATGRKVVENICFVKKNVPEIGVLESTRTRKDIEWAMQVAGQVLDAIEKKVFPMTDPTGWQCQPAYCGYWSMCRGKK